MVNALESAFLVPSEALRVLDPIKSISTDSPAPKETVPPERALMRVPPRVPVPADLVRVTFAEEAAPVETRLPKASLSSMATLMSVPATVGSVGCVVQANEFAAAWTIVKGSDALTILPVSIVTALVAVISLLPMRLI